MTLKLIIRNEVVKTRQITPEVLASKINFAREVMRLKSTYTHMLSRDDWYIVLEGVPSKGNDIPRHFPAIYTNSTPFKIAKEVV